MKLRKYWRLLAAVYIDFIFVGTIRNSSLIFLEWMRLYKIQRDEAALPIAFTYIFRSLSGSIGGCLGHTLGIQVPIVFGCCMGSFALALCFWAPNILAINILYGVLLGLSMGMTASVMPQFLKFYYSKYTTMANGVYFSGSSIAILTLAPIIKASIDYFSISGTFLILSGLMMQTIPLSLLMKEKKSSSISFRKQNKLLRRSNLTSNIYFMNQKFCKTKYDDQYLYELKPNLLNDVVFQSKPEREVQQFMRITPEVTHKSDEVQHLEHTNNKSDAINFDNFELDQGVDFYKDSCHENGKDIHTEINIAETAVKRSIRDSCEILSEDFLNIYESYNFKYIDDSSDNSSAEIKPIIKPKTDEVQTLDHTDIKSDVVNADSLELDRRADFYNDNSSEVGEDIPTEINITETATKRSVRDSCETLSEDFLNIYESYNFKYIDDSSDSSSAEVISNAQIETGNIDIVHNSAYSFDGFNVSETSKYKDDSSDNSSAEVILNAQVETDKIDIIRNSVYLFDGFNEAESSKQAKNVYAPLYKNSDNEESFNKCDANSLSTFDIVDTSHVEDINFENSDNFVSSDKLKRPSKEKFSSCLLTLLLLKDPVYLTMISINGILVLNMQLINILFIDIFIEKEIPVLQSVHLLMLCGLGEIAGCVSFAWIPDRGYMKSNNYTAACILARLLAFVSLMRFKNWNMRMLNAVVFGLTYGALSASIPGNVFQMIAKDKQTVAIGSLRLASIPFSFLGPPLIGYFKDNLGSYNGLIYVITGFYLLCSISYALLPSIQTQFGKK